jgi:threonyl-tRNA synthetase
MKLLSLHCDYIKFKALKPAIKGITLDKSEEKQVEVKEPLVILTAVEKQDESNKEILQEYIKNILDLKEKIGKVERIVLYPYAHLSSSLSAPDFAKNLLIEAEAELKKKKLEVHRAPFGFYKEFELKCKGHPLSELSRSIGSQESISVNQASSNTPILSKEEVYDPKQLLREISKSKLNREKLAENDHRILGQQMDLFSFSEVAPGMVFWHDKGLIIFNELVNYWRDEHRKAGYFEISTPQVMDRKLWEISGHWKLYKENMFTTKYEGREFSIKPMNCPGGFLVYRNKPRTYKELPMRVGELGKVHRLELSGVLAGLFRVIQFTQDDAHIFCTEEQLESEIIGVVELFKKMLGKFGFKDYKFSLSTRSEEKKDKYLGSDELWNKAEATFEKAMKKMKITFAKQPGEAKFYGPSLDVLIKDSLGREWQCSTLQLDFNLPQRFEIEYTGPDSKPHTPIMLHRVVYGSLERFIGVLLEHTNGRLPTWLAPVQVRVLSFTDKNIKSAEKLHQEFKDAGIRCELDIDSAPVQGRVREAELQKIPYIIMIGDKEEQAKTLAVRHEGKVKFGVKKEDFLKELLSEIKERN